MSLAGLCRWNTNAIWTPRFQILSSLPSSFKVVRLLWSQWDKSFEAVKLFGNRTDIKTVYLSIACFFGN
jgi:hypothetical protein